jgi:hypothetical protein
MILVLPFRPPTKIKLSLWLHNSANSCRSCYNSCSQNTCRCLEHVSFVEHVSFKLYSQYGMSAKFFPSILTFSDATLIPRIHPMQSLPVELIQEVAQHLASTFSHRSLAALNVTSHWFRKATPPILFRTVTLVTQGPEGRSQGKALHIGRGAGAFAGRSSIYSVRMISLSECLLTLTSTRADSSLPAVRLFGNWFQTLS